MRALSKITKIILGVAVVHCLLTIFLFPIGWERLYSWDSPHWLRAIWACIFSLPLLIVFAHGWFPAWVVTFLLVPLNSLVLSWMVIKPAHDFSEFRRTRHRRGMTRAMLTFGFSVIVLGAIAVVWVPPNIVSAREALLHNLQEIDRWQKTNSTHRP